MKKLFLSLVVAALFGMPFAIARDASGVRVTVKQQAGKPVTVKKLAGQSSGFNGVEGLMEQHKTGGWHMVNIPLTVEAYSKQKDDAGNPLPVHYIPSLTIKVHLLFKHQDAQARTPQAAMLSKELTYVNIPVPNKGEKAGTRKNEMYAGVFISPADAWNISEATKGELDGTLVAYAVEATFNGAKCMNSDREKHPQFEVMDRKLERDWNISGKWWEKTGVDTAGAKLLSINETPYAYAAGAFYPQLEVAAAAPAGSTSSVSDATMGVDTSSTETTGTSTDDSSTAADSVGVEADAADESKGGKRSKGKRAKGKRRGSSL